MSVKCLSQEQKEHLVACYKNKLTLTELSEMFEVSMKTVTRVLIETGEIHKQWRSEINLTKEEGDLISTLREQQINPNDLVSKKQMTIKTVAEWFNNLSTSYKGAVVKALAADLRSQLPARTQ